MKILFNKYEGAGNDFVIIRGDAFPGLKTDPLIIKKLCDRRFGIGADGVILVDECSGYDFRMSYFNSDGSPGTMCGNGGRCASHFVMRQITGFRDLAFIADDGAHTAKHVKDNIIELSIRDVDKTGETPDGILVNTGVPHLVVFADDIEDTDLVAFARPIRYSSRYAPEGVNVNLAAVTGDTLAVRTYERGVEDETLSCGTGVTASAIAAVATGRIVTNEVRVKVRGGNLSVRFSLTGTGASEISLTGPATFVFSGETEI
jgi:diaminopimelate epimerase